LKTNLENLEKIKFSTLQHFGYCWIAGGAIADFFLDKKPYDVDVYFPSEKAKKKAINKFKNLGAKVIREYPLITKIFYRGAKYDFAFLKSTPEECIKQFDYTVCSAAIDKDEKFFSHPDFFQHIEEKKLHYMGDAISSPVVKARRLQKHLRKGYKMNEEELKLWLDNLIKENQKSRRRV
jgi:hypothetical protein